MRYVRAPRFGDELPDMETRGGELVWVVNSEPVDMEELVSQGYFTVETDDKCWCGGRVGQRDDNGLGCLDSVYHDWNSTGDPESIQTLYVAGPMSGYLDNNYPAFNLVSQKLRDAGYRVVNPAEFGSDKGHYVDLLRQDLIGLLGCDAIAFHGDWWLSSGARNEINVGGLLRMPVRHWAEWITLKENADGK